MKVYKKIKTNSNEISPWANTQATREASCPHCTMIAGAPCQTPSGREANRTHVARRKVYLTKIGRVEFMRRHARVARKYNIMDIIKKTV